MGWLKTPELDDKLFGCYPNLHVIANWTILISQIYFCIVSAIAFVGFWLAVIKVGFLYALIVPLLWFIGAFVPLVVSFASIEVLTVFLQCENHLREIRNK